MRIYKGKISFVTLLIIVSMILYITTMVIFMLVMYNDIIGFVQKQATDAQCSILLQLSQRLNLNLLRFQNLANLTTADESLVRNVIKLDEYKSLIYEKSVIYKDINAHLNTLKAIDKMIDSITIVSRTESICVGQDKPIKLVLDDFSVLINDELLQPKQNNALLMYFPDGLLNEKTSYFEPDSMFFVAGIYSDDKICGLLFIKLSGRLFSSVLGNTAYSAVVYNGNELWSHPKFSIENIQNIITQIDTHNSAYLKLDNTDGGRLFYSRISTDFGYLLIKEDMDKVISCLNRLYYIFLIYIIISITITLLISRLFARRMMRPISSLINDVRAYKNPIRDKQMNTVHERLTLRGKIILYFILSVGFPLMLFVCTFFGTYYSIVRENLMEMRADIVSQNNENLSQFIERKQYFTLDMGRNIILQNLFIKSDISQQQYGFENLCRYYFSMWNHAEKMVFLNKEGNVIYDTTGTTVNFILPLFEMYHDAKGGLIWLGLNYNDYNQPVVVMVNVIKGSILSGESRKMSLETIGYILTIIDEEQLSSAYQDLKSISGLIVYVLHHDRIVSCQNKSLLGVHAAKVIGLEAGMTTNTYEVRSTPFSISIICDNEELKSSIMEMLYAKVYLVVIVFLLLLLIFSELGYLLLRPMGRIQSKLAGYMATDIPGLFTEYGIIAEVDELSRSFNEMQGRIYSLMDDLISARSRENQLEIDKKNAEIKSLQSQIRPHFLCNTLESVRYLIKTNMHSDAIKMLTNLGDLFRYGISKQETLITLEQEIIYATAYCNIMKYRFSDGISFIWKVDDATTKHLVPKMILQPILENAIEHGIKPKGGEGMVTVACRMEYNKILMSVQDDGIGFNAGNIRQNASEKHSDHRRIGLANVIERIRLYYGEDGIFNIESETGTGTIVTLGIPVTQERIIT